MPVRRLQRQLKAALSLLPRSLPESILGLEITLIDRATMARTHADFLGDASETDVITFPYGEILICPAVAERQAPRHGLSLQDEILLYALHGILHLAGYDDTTPRLAAEMKRAQNRLLRRVLKLNPQNL